MKEQLKVLMYPDYRSSNHYQRLLEDELTKLGVQLICPVKKFTPFILTKNILKHKVDVIHLHWINPFVSSNIFTFFALIAILICDTVLVKHFFKKEIVWTVHNTFTHECKYPRLELIERKYLASISKFIFCHSISAKKEISKEYGVDFSKIRIITHGNYIDSYDNSLNKIESRKILNLKTDSVVYLFFGQIRSYKGIENLITAFTVLNANNTKLLIVGNPKDFETERWVNSMSNKNEDVITKLKFVPDDEIQVYMNASDVVVLPFKKILTSGSAILAISFGKPVIAPEIDYVKEILDQKGSVLYDSSDDSSLIDAMNTFLKSDIKQMGKHNFELAKKLDWYQSAQKTYDVYKSCIFK